MVYCGKASQGCQNCRTRRIKCDKVRPECSQCIRLGKKCPGYRDQLSLMFRDESSKVMQKAHAQWGGEPDPSSAGPSSLASPSSASSASSNSIFIPTPRSSTRSPTTTDESPGFKLGNDLFSDPNLSLLNTSLGPSATEQGVQFYIDHYLLGYPDEPKTVGELGDRPWLYHPSVQTIMAAVGLAGLSNLNGNDHLKTLARQQYVTALQDTGKSLANPGTIQMEVVLRGVVMLALYEVVKGFQDSTINSVKTHIMGAAALLRGFLPVSQAPAGGFRGLIQLCYTMLVPSHSAGVTLPMTFFDWLSLAAKSLPADERPSTDLLPVLTRFVHLSAYVRGHALVDGRPKTVDIIEQAIQLDADLEAWESSAEGKWLFTVHEGKFPPEACFRGQYHNYSDMTVARIWNYYRWARILVNQMILGFAQSYPTSTLTLLSAPQLSRCLEIVLRLAEGVLTSIPTHWKHPALSRGQRDQVESLGGAGSGAGGVPATLFHLQVASCAPGVPREYWQWALAVLDTIWGDMGMIQAKTMAEALRAHQDRLQTETADGLLKTEPVEMF